ncbi:hypothetical protein FA95DRAFT_1554455 [Auriscalpium vulgare]|uniref:Uncharacterized protein n=1 Tax=Auriscalpium vulgare TaxID=40419 RepID=A0ACB8S5G5_9AGAM|nr:hypothetical protein FA95DRAFT_1554455 [Auriscalpium vulgare]
MSDNGSSYGDSDVSCEGNSESYKGDAYDALKTVMHSPLTWRTHPTKVLRTPLRRRPTLVQRTPTRARSSDLSSSRGRDTSSSRASGLSSSDGYVPRTDYGTSRTGNYPNFMRSHGLEMGDHDEHLEGKAILDGCRAVDNAEYKEAQGQR